MTIKIIIKCSKCEKESTVYNMNEVDVFKYMGWRFCSKDNSLHTCSECYKKQQNPNKGEKKDERKETESRSG